MSLSMTKAAPITANEARQVADGPRMGLAYRAGRVLNRIVLQATSGLQVEGSEYVPGRPFILAAAPYRSGIDAYALSGALPDSTAISFLANHDVTGGPPWRSLGLHLWNAATRWSRLTIPLHPEGRSVDLGALRSAQRFLSDGGVLGIFPEGKRSRQETALLPLHEGAALLAFLTAVPILPATLTSYGQLWPGHGRLTVRFGAPIEPGTTEGSPREQRTALTGQLRQALRSLIVSGGDA